MISTHPGARAWRSAEEFDSLVAPHRPRMFRAARRILPSDDLAHDAVQDVVTRLWFDGYLDERADAALVHLVTLRARHLLRGARRREHHEGNAACACDACRPEDDPAQHFTSFELDDEIERALARLTPEQRTAFELHACRELDYEAIARGTGTPLGTVRSRIHRARKVLRELLQGHCPACGDGLE